MSTNSGTVSGGAEDLGDTLLRLWDEWFASWSSADLLQWSAAENHEEELDRHASRIVATGFVEPELLNPPGPWEAFLLVAAIDRALEQAHPRLRSSFVPSGLASISTRWHRFGRLDTGQRSGGVAIWAGGASGHTDDPTSYFTAVRVVESMTHRTLSFVRPAIHDRIDPFVGSTARPLRVACLPWLTEADDLLFSVVDTGQGDGFKVDLSARRSVDELVAVLDDLDGLNVDIALLPEAVLDVEMLDRWRAAIRQSPGARRLRWIVVGTGPVDPDYTAPPVNEAVLLSRLTGQDVVRQRKRRGFSLNDHRVATWGLADSFGHSPGVLQEWTYFGTTWSLLDDGPFRFAVAICEDLDRNDEAAGGLRAVRPTHILAPILDGELVAGGWPDMAARDWQNTSGAVTVVSNSAVIAARQADPSAAPLTALVNNGVLPDHYTDDVYPGPSVLAGADPDWGGAVFEA